MTNLSLRMRFILFATAFNVLLAASIIVQLAMHGFEWLLLGLLFVGFIISALLQVMSRKWLAPLDKLGNAMQEVSAGRFQHRITHIDTSTELGRLCWNLNDMLDQLETFNREQTTTFQHHLDGHFYRKTMPVGLHGGFRKVTCPL